jgi:hypothetical protein
MRADQIVVEQTVSDIVDMVKCVEEREKLQKQQVDLSFNGSGFEMMET